MEIAIPSVLILNGSWLPRFQSNRTLASLHRGSPSATRAICGWVRYSAISSSITARSVGHASRGEFAPMSGAGGTADRILL
jgi:hypothetical protein